MPTGDTFIAYKVTNLLNGRAYIGVTTQRLAKRWRGHVSWATSGRKGCLADAIREHGEAAFIVEHLACAKSWDDLLAVEQALVAQERTLVWDGGYNVTEGGEGMRGYVMPEAQRLAIKARMAGVPKRPETRAKIAASRLGTKHSLETRAKMSKAHKGKPHSPEWVQRQALTLRGRPKSTAHREKLSAAKRAYEAAKRGQGADQGRLDLC